jgi:hypothetical protein
MRLYQVDGLTTIAETPMNAEKFRGWLQQEKKTVKKSTIDTLISDANRVDREYGNLDQHYDDDKLESVISSLRYTANDKSTARPNPSKFPNIDPYKSLPAYRNAVAQYRKFRDTAAGNNAEVADINDTADPGQRIGLERDLQAALRAKIDQLEPGLVIIDSGMERSVDSGLIDITAQDSSGKIVVIELKAGIANQRAVAQILSYMGDIAMEDTGVDVRGILVASDFDKKAQAAARIVPSLVLRRYAIHFQFF